MIAVVGGSGLIGGGVLARLRAEGRDVVGLTHNAARATQTGWRFGDMRRADTLAPAFEGVTCVIHSGQFPNFPFENRRRGYTFDNYDGEGTERLVSAAEKAGVRRFVMVSGVGVETSSHKPYYRAIRRGEQAVLGSKMEGVCFRPAFVYGPRDAGLNRLFRIASHLPVLPTVGLDAEHQPVFIDDVSAVLAELAKLGNPTGVFELGGPERMTSRRMFETAFALKRIRCRLLPMKKGVGSLVGGLLERLPGELASRAAVDFICEDFIADNTRSLSVLPLPLTSFRDGLSSYVS